MKSNCSNNCIKAYVLIQESSLIQIINDFTNNLDSVEDNPSMIQQFYDYLKLKYKIPCEIGMLFIEKIVMINIFEKFKIKFDSMNNMVNKKILIYEWIKPEHLEIADRGFEECITRLHKITKSEVPSVKRHYLMTFMDLLYSKVGRSAGYDSFFPYLVYCIIKSQVKDIYAHFYILKVFGRQYDSSCKFGCNHGFNMTVICDCLVSGCYGSEADYYITMSLAAIDFIAKIEFYNLKIKVSDFEREIINSLKNIDLREKNDTT